MNEIAGIAPRSEPNVPSTYTDRSALSEAWYRALYTPQPKTGEAAANANRRPAGAGNASVGRIPGPPREHASAPVPREASGAVRRRLAGAGGIATHRIRAARISNVGRSSTPTAWRAAVARHTLCRLTLPDGAKLDLLVHQRGCRVRVVAIASAPALAARKLEAALGRARTALALNGIRADIDHRQKGSA